MFDQAHHPYFLLKLATPALFILGLTGCQNGPSVQDQSRLQSLKTTASEKAKAIEETAAFLPAAGQKTLSLRLVTLNNELCSQAPLAACYREGGKLTASEAAEALQTNIELMPERRLTASDAEEQRAALVNLVLGIDRLEPGPVSIQRASY